MRDLYSKSEYAYKILRLTYKQLEHLDGEVASERAKSDFDLYAEDVFRAHVLARLRRCPRCNIYQFGNLLMNWGKELNQNVMGMVGTEALMPDGFPVEPESVSDDGGATSVERPRLSGWEVLSVSARGKTAKKEDVVEWVYQNIGVPVWEIDRAGVPDSGAVAMLQWANTDQGRNQFMGKFVDLVTKRMVDRETNAFLDDGLEVLKLIPKMMAAQKDQDGASETKEVAT
jgi:hypothetical protein